jgi:hypothetical protein
MCPGGCLHEPMEPIMSPFFGRAAVTSAGLMLLGAASVAQTGPPPGPIKTPPPVENPSGKSIVINPTEDECKRGWTASTRWTKEQFNDFCGKLRASK